MPKQKRELRTSFEVVTAIGPLVVALPDMKRHLAAGAKFASEGERTAYAEAMELSGNALAALPDVHEAPAGSAAKKSSKKPESPKEA